VRKSWLLASVLVLFFGLSALFYPKISKAQTTSDFDAFKADLQFVLGKTKAALLFDPFGTNPDPHFKKHYLHDTQVLDLCGGVQGKCGNLGVNFATTFGHGTYEKTDSFGMQWTLEIAEKNNPGAVLAAINAHNSTTIVRIGIADSGLGFDKWNANPNRIAGDYIDFLQTLSRGAAGKEFYAIAGPNEPDIENWFAPECGRYSSGAGNIYFDCIGPALAQYMNAVCAAKPSNVRLLSPAFNLTSPSFDGIYKGMQKAGANFDCIDAFAGNLYPAGQSMQQYWKDQNLDRFSKPLIITETEPWNPLADPGSSVAAPNLAYNPSIFHLSPFAGLYPDPGRRDYAQIQADLVEQGYQAYCAFPEQQIVGSVGPADIVKMFLSFGGDEELNLNPILTLDYSLARTPLFRDSERKYQIKSDLEEYWSYQEPTSTTYSEAELSSAPIESLLSESQRCAEGAKNLWAQDDMCTKLINPDACALYKFLIPNTSHTVKSLLAEYRSAGGQEKNMTAICKELEQSSDAAKKQVFTDLTQVPLTTESGYRLAFLVLSLKELKPEPNKLFSFFAHGTLPRDEVLVVAFKIPDVITNKPSVNAFSGSNSKAYPFFADGAMLARDSLLTVNQQALAADRKTELKSTLANTVTAVMGQGPSNPIYCLDGQPPNGTGSIACNDQLVKALTDIVNAQDQIDGKQLNCAGPEDIDQSFSIDEPAAAQQQNPRAIFPETFGSELVTQLFLQLASTSTDKVARELISKFIINKISTRDGTFLSDSTSLKAYLVYPVGYELAEVENVLINSFLTDKQIETINQDPNLNKRFELFGGTTKLTKNTESFTIFDPGKCVRTKGKDCWSAIVATIDLPKLPQIQFLGAKLGYYLRAIQRALAKEASSVQTYLAACKTTEEFLLDRCAGLQQKEPQKSLSYCGAKELTLTNTTTTSFRICRTGVPPENCEPIDQGSEAYFLDQSSDYTLELVTRILDGGTLITTGSIVTMNPGQYQTENGAMPRCGVGPYDITAGQIWYLPPDVPIEEVIKPEAWDKRGSKLVPATGTKDWTNVIASFRVKPGYYFVPSYTFGCLSRGAVWTDKNGNTSIDPFSQGSAAIIPVGVGMNGRKSYCAKATFNSNMPGGPDGADHVFVTDSYGCSVAGKGYDIMLNSSCGGLNGAGNLELWSELFKPDDESGTNKLPGLALYEQIFGRKFELPYLGKDEAMSCDNLFPNTIREVGCDEVSNSDVGSISKFGKDIKFDIQYWNNSTVTFTPPSQTIWDSIQAASQRYGCDPLLALAVAHSESSVYNNTTESSAGARGVWQFTPGAWGIWTTPYNTGASACANHEPTSFTPEYMSGLGVDFSSPTNIPAAADAACRLVLWTGAQKYPDNQNAFASAFAVRGENSYGQIWNAHTPQAKYVWSLWKKLRDEMGQPAKTPPANYPDPACY